MLSCLCSGCKIEGQRVRNVEGGEKEENRERETEADVYKRQKEARWQRDGIRQR